MFKTKTAGLFRHSFFVAGLGISLLAVLFIFALIFSRPTNLQYAIKEYQKNQTDWDERVRNASSKDTEKKFVVLEAELAGDDQIFIIYDESDELANPRGLHIQFWKQNTTVGSTAVMGHVLAERIDGHYFFVRVDASNNGYVFVNNGSDYAIKQWNCSIIEDPVRTACPDQWKEMADGRIVPVYEYASKNQRK